MPKNQNGGWKIWLWKGVQMGGGKYFGNFQGGGEINFPRQFHSCRPRMFEIGQKLVYSS